MSCNGEPGHPREKSIKDLIRHVESLQEEGNHIIIALDINTKHTDKHGIIEKLKHKCQLEELVHTTCKIPKHQEGTHQIDFALESIMIKSFISYSTIQEYGEVCGSDHRSTIIDVKLKQMNYQQREHALDQPQKITTKLRENITV